MDKKSGVALTLIGLAVLAGVAIAAGGNGWAGQNAPSSQSETLAETTHGETTRGETARSGDEVGLAVAESGPTCLDDTVASRSGWVHLSGNGEDAAVSFDLTVTRDAEVRLSNRGSGDYVLHITTKEAASATGDSAKSGDESGCESVVRLEGSGLVPDVETLRVMVNDETIRTIEKRDSFAELRELPEPITSENATTA